MRAMQVFSRWCIPALLWPLAAWAEFTPESPYEEMLDPPTPVSGHSVVGVTLVGSPPATKSDRLWVRINANDPPGRIRVKVASANGRLRGEGTWAFEAKPPARTWYEIKIPPKAGRPDTAEWLAVAVQPASDAASAAVPVFLLASLGATAPQNAIAAARVRLHVNTRRAEVFVYRDAIPEPTRCIPIAGTQTVRFDAICDLPLELGAQPQTLPLTLVRRDGSQTSRQKVELRW